MDRFTGLFGIVFILGIAFLLSNNRRAISKRVVIVGILLQVALALFILKVPIGQAMFAGLGFFITKLLDYSNEGGAFVFGPLVHSEMLSKAFGQGQTFIFFFKILPTIIFISVLVSIGYYLGLMQILISLIAKVVYRLMGVSGSEALSNAASAFVGQVEAQIMIKPYINGMTKSELLASMSGSMACIAGGVMAVYISMGVPAEFLITASIMAVPGSLVISKIVYPEVEESETKGEIKLEIKKTQVNIVDAISQGASDGLKVALNVIAMLIGFMALIALVDGGLGLLGRGLAHLGVSLDFIGIDIKRLSLTEILGAIFSIFAYLMGVPSKDIHTVGGLLGTKIVANEFVAYSNLSGMIKDHLLSPKSLTIVSIALCGFANFLSIGIQIGGIGGLAPERRKDLASLGFRALICGTLASYLSATIVGIIS